MQPRLRVVPRKVELGAVALSEVKLVEARICNDGASPLRLDQPLSTCGCVKPTLPVTTVPPRGEVSLRLRVTAPTTPENILQTVTLTSRDAPGVSWAVTVLGRAEAEIWASPPRLEVEVDDSGEGRRDFTVHSVLRVEPLEVESSSEFLRVEQLSDATASRRYRLHIHRATEGDAFLNVFQNDGKLALQVPVRWHRRAEVTMRPEYMFIPGGEAARKVVFLTVDPRKAGMEPIVEPLVPWLRIMRRRQLNRHTFELEILADSTSVPQQIEPGMPLFAARLQRPKAPNYHFLGYPIRSASSRGLD
ncbi:MAG TPA: DUF1573 domain-containing protein [Pirellulales bacterium]|nr:DUF1573 domain-containing protein [Pirellulales bacterium]